MKSKFGKLHRILNGQNQFRIFLEHMVSFSLNMNLSINFMFLNFILSIAEIYIIYTIYYAIYIIFIYVVDDLFS